MDQRFTLQRLIAELGTTQIQAMLWRLDHQKSAQTTVEQEFAFLTGRQLPECPVEVQEAFLKKIQTEYLEHLRKSPDASSSST